MLYFAQKSNVHSFSIVSESVELFCKAVASVLTDEGFQLETEHTTAAVKTASAVLEWCKDPRNNEKLSSFSHVLVVRLRACFCRKYRTFQLKRERMWGNYHQF